MGSVQWQQADAESRHLRIDLPLIRLLVGAGGSTSRWAAGVMPRVWRPFPAAWAQHFSAAEPELRRESRGEGVDLRSQDWAKILLLLALVLLTPANSVNGEKAFTHTSLDQCVLPAAAKGCRSAKRNLSAEQLDEHCFPTWLLACSFKKCSGHWCLYVGSRYVMGVHAILCWYIRGRPTAGRYLACHFKCGREQCLNPLHVSWGNVVDNAYHLQHHKLQKTGLVHTDAQQQAPADYVPPSHRQKVRPQRLKRKRSGGRFG